MRPGVVICADWSTSEKKRAAWAADLGAGRVFRLKTPVTVERLVTVAGNLAKGAPALVAVDAPIGIPAGYLAAAAARWPAAGRGFLPWLDAVVEEAGFWEPVTTPEDWSVERPFFKVQPGKGGLTKFQDRAAQAGVPLRRAIDAATNAKPVFAAGIPGQVALQAQALWREIVAARAGDAEFEIWPFETDLVPVEGEADIVLAEVYPAAAYGIALAYQLPAEPTRLAKTKRAVRVTATADATRESLNWWPGLTIQEPERWEAGEDDFDAGMAVLALARLAREGQLWPSAGVDPRAEGGMLGVAGG